VADHNAKRAGKVAATLMSQTDILGNFWVMIKAAKDRKPWRLC